MLGAVFDQFVFNASAGIDFAGSGVFVLIGSEVKPLRLRLAVFLGDEPALKEFFCTKGHQGARCCALCSNICLQRYLTATRAAMGDISSTELDFGRFNAHTDDSVRLSAKILADEHAKKGTREFIGIGNFEEMELRLGLNHNPHNFVNKSYVAVVSGLMFDWMHIYLVGGLLIQEFGLTMQMLQKARHCTYGSLRVFLGEWVWPHANRINLDRLFNKKVDKENTASASFSCGASEMLTLLPTLALFMSTLVGRVEGPCLAAVLSLVACMDVVELLQQVKAGIVAPALLETAVCDHLQKRRAAHGTEIDANAIKAHQAGHLPRQMQEHAGRLYSCFVQERHHRLLTKYAAVRKQTKSYERGVVEEITVEQIQDLEVNWLHIGLVNPREPPRHTASVLRDLGFVGVVTSLTYKAAFGSVHVGDAISVRSANGDCIGEVAVLFQQGDVDYVIVSPWEPLHAADVPKNAMRVDTTGVGLRVFEAACIHATLPHTRPSPENSVVLVKLPPSLRR